MSDRGATTRRGPLSMSARRRWILYVVDGGVWGTGVLWLIYHYFLRKQGPFGFVNNPLEHWWIVAHAALSFGAIWLFGLVWAHVAGGWSMRWRRWSGGTLFGVLTVLIFSGYGLYYIDSQKIHSWVSILHWGVGLAALAAFVIHRLSKSAPRTDRARRAATARGAS